MKLQEHRGLIVITIALIVLSALALTYTLARLRENFTWVEHTNTVIRTLNGSSRAMLSAESNERGYLLTGDQSYLDGYKQARDNALRLVERMERLVIDNPEQAERLKALRPDIMARIAEFDDSVALGPPSLALALERLSVARTRQLTQRVEEKFDDMRELELLLLAERQTRVNRSTLQVAILTACMGVLGVISAGIGATLSARQRSLAALQSANDALAASESGLKERQAHLTAILATVPDAMVTIDENGRIGSFSAAAERLFKYAQSEVIGQNVSILVPAPSDDEDGSSLTRYITSNAPDSIGTGRMMTGARKDGTTFPMELSVGQINLAGRREFVGFVRDLTERHDRERKVHDIQGELFRVSRLSTMGEMAGALAHELNQPLAAVSNYINAARRSLDRLDDDATKPVRDIIGKAADQVLLAGSVIQRLREFISRGQTERQIVTLRQMVEESVGLAFLAVKDRTVQLAMEFDPAVDRVLVDKIQIQQVLLNLIRNAIEAMQTTERALRVTTRPAQNDMVRVEVADRGTGISPEMATRLFEPFATSKSTGMGIGLSISRTIIESHGGNIDVAPNPGGGTIFRFTLPVAPAETLEPARAG